MSRNRMSSEHQLGVGNIYRAFEARLHERYADARINDGFAPEEPWELRAIKAECLLLVARYMRLYRASGKAS